MAISTFVLALTGGGGSAPAPAPKTPDKSGLKEWVKKYLQALGRALVNLAGPARYHWLNCLLALGYMGKDGDLARRKFVGLGHCYGDPASRGCGPARYHWLNCLLALRYIGKECDLARRKFVGLGHCYGDPASRGCSGLASETITKAPQGHPLPQRP